jgi:hypothetical protein
MSGPLDRTAALSDALSKKMRALFDELLDRNGHAIAHELLRSEDGSGGVSLKFGFQFVNGAVGTDAKISWSRKFEDKEEGTFRFADPQNPGLPGIEGDAPEDGRKVTIRAGEKEITTTLGAIKRAGRRKPNAEGLSNE